MPRFYFHVRQGDDLTADLEGQDFADLATAREEACEGARELIVEALRNKEEVGHRQIEIADEHGALLDTVPVHAPLDNLKQ